MKFFIFLLVLSFNSYASSFENISFMQGCWGRTGSNGTRMTEDWFKPTTKVMLGISQTIRQDNTMVEYEFFEVKHSEETVTYTPILNGRKLNTFTANEIRIDGVTFSDLNNPGLKHIAYDRMGNVLKITLKGLRSGKDFEMSHELQLEDCKNRF